MVDGISRITLKESQEFHRFLMKFYTCLMEPVRPKVIYKVSMGKFQARYSRRKTKIIVKVTFVDETWDLREGNLR